ncbi:hypothetical protein ABER99_22550, partial [Paenibacillus glucanolyticus]|uniref:hypothetical protein n=1 Tax=Paenibacillus glucanolyticus TaxID=59843 RepID=UPI003D2AD303
CEFSYGKLSADHYRFSGIDTSSPLVRGGHAHKKLLPLVVGGRKKREARYAVISFLQSLLSPNFQE